MESRPEGIPTPIHFSTVLPKVAVESIFLIVRGDRKRKTAALERIDYLFMLGFVGLCWANFNHDNQFNPHQNKFS